MKVGRFGISWVLPAILLVAVIATAGIIFYLKFHGNSPIEISVIPLESLQGTVSVDGEVNNPGLYPLRAGDTIEGIIRSAGGVKDKGDLEQVELIINGSNRETPQKININKAEAWLLEALPGIGEARARAIVEYRQESGQFHDIRELSKVPGLGEATIEGIRHLITVGDY
jgi:competence protein ComEA